MDAMHSTDVSTSHASGSHTYHVLPVCLLVCSLFLFTFLFTLPLWIVDSSMLTFLSYTYSLMTCQLVRRLVIPRLMTPLPLTPVCTCIYQPGIYTVGDVDLFLIFNLLCNHPTSATCEIPCTLLIPSSSLAKATALRPVERSSFASLC